MTDDERSPCAETGMGSKADEASVMRRGEKRNPYRFYSNGRLKTPHLGTMCTDDDGHPARHKVCGGWWCTCACHDDVNMAEGSFIAEHVDHKWEEVAGCVYCTCGPAVRLYQGTAASGEEKQAMAAFFDALHSEAVTEWKFMREQVERARADG